MGDLQALPHGTVGGYDNYGCRCLECTAAKAAAMREYRAQRASFVVNGVHPTAPHGTDTGYDTYRCRCEPCRQAKKDQLRDWSARRLSERVQIDGRLVHPNANHGTRSAYLHFGCRCSACVEQERTRKAAKRRRREGIA